MTERANVRHPNDIPCHTGKTFRASITDGYDVQSCVVFFVEIKKM